MSGRLARPFDELQRSRAMRLSVADAAAWALMVGLGESYFLAAAVRLGASALQKGLVLSLPLCLGTAGPFLALRLMARARARRPLVVACALLQSLTLGALAISVGLGLGGPAVLIALACVYQVCGQAAGTAWGSWYGDLVPAQRRGRYFALRNRYAHFAVFAGLLLGGAGLHSFEPGAVGATGRPTGFALIFGAAASFRLISAALLAASPEPAFRGLGLRAGSVRHLVSGRGLRIGRLIVLVALLQGTVWLASPYFHPYMLEQLRFDYIDYMLASLAIAAAKGLSLPLWGRAVDRYGSRRVFAACAFSVAMVPLPWVWVGGLGGALAAQALSGVSWAGFELSQFTLVLDGTGRRTRPSVLSALGALTGGAQLLGSLGGAYLIQGAGMAMVTVFATSAALRLAVAGAIARFAPEVRGPSRSRGAPAVRLAGVRPSGGAYRPIPYAGPRLSGRR